MRSGVDPPARASRLSELLQAHTPAAAPDLRLVELVELVERDPDLQRVDQLAKVAGWSTRTLQRRFRTDVGIGPKWVLARSRLQNAALALEEDPGVDLAALAHRLGWYDQAHFNNDLQDMLGASPGGYAASTTETG